MAKRDRSPAAVALAFAARHGLDFDAEDAARVAALVRAVRRECARVVMRRRNEAEGARGIAAGHGRERVASHRQSDVETCERILLDLAALNRAPRRGR